jgi:hypothetical protein
MIFKGYTQKTPKNRVFMSIFGLIISILLTFFSTFVLAYISMATMIGPWIAPTIVLIAGLVLKIASGKVNRTRELVLIQTVSSVGGIVATAAGFTFPTLYFLDRPTFNCLLSNMPSFCLIIGALCLSGGSLGILLGRAFRRKFLAKTDANRELSFPVSQLVYKTITSQSQAKQTKQMLFGFSISGIICFLRDFFKFKQFFAFRSIFGQTFPIIIMPMLLAIGFIVGTNIVFPLLVGMLSKYFILYPVNHHSTYLPFRLFHVLDKKIFAMAFCSGLILADVLPGILRYPSIIMNSIKKYSGFSYAQKINNFSLKPAKLFKNFEVILSLISIFFLMFYFNFPSLVFVVMIPLTIISAYNISYLGCKIGFVQIGRFTTFVMIPIILLFKLTPLQITILCVLISVCITTASDVLFDYKIGDLCKISHKTIYRYQWLGLLITALGLGFFLWLLFTNLQIGTTELFAQRGKARALLIQSFSFNWTVLFLGFLYGFILKKLRISPSMVFGGVIMPNALTLGLVFGALGTLFVKDKKAHIPLFSGIFAGESIWLIASIVIRFL